jgi:hypothetical protein
VEGKYEAIEDLADEHPELTPREVVEQWMACLARQGQVLDEEDDEDEEEAVRAAMADMVAAYRAGLRARLG